MFKLHLEYEFYIFKENILLVILDNPQWNLSITLTHLALPPTQSVNRSQSHKARRYDCNTRKIKEMKK